MVSWRGAGFYLTRVSGYTGDRLDWHAGNKKSRIFPPKDSLNIGGGIRLFCYPRDRILAFKPHTR